MIDWLRRAFGFEKQAVYRPAKPSSLTPNLPLGNGTIHS
jgi:hypothetical protein